MSAKKETLKKRLKEKFPEIVFFDHSEFGISAESGSNTPDGWPLADYYDYPDLKEIRSTFGVHNDVIKLVESLGWECQWINAGMLGLYKN